MGDEARQKLYYGWIIVTVSFVTMAIVSPAWFGFSLFYPPILAEFGWSRASTAGAYSLNLIISSAVSPMVGYLIDRYGPRVVMPTGALIFAAGFVGSGRINALWQFYLWFGVVAALGFCAVQVVPNAGLVTNWFGRNRATAMGIMMSGMGLGRLAMFPLIQYSISRFGWRASYSIIAGILVFVVAPLILIFQRQRPADKGLQDHPEVASGRPATPGLSKRKVVVIDQEWASTDWTLRSAGRTYRFWSLALLIAVYSGGLFVIVVQVVAYLKSAGVDPLVAASFIGLQGLLSSAGSFFGGALSDRIGREKTMTLSIAIFILGIIALGLVESIHSTSLLYGYAALFGVGFGMAFPTVMASTADLFQGKHYGSIFGAINFIGGIGQAVGAWLGGYLYDTTHSYRVLFSATIGAVALSTVFIWTARPGKVRVVRSVAQISGRAAKALSAQRGGG
jgi:MFS family permease